MCDLTVLVVLRSVGRPSVRQVIHRADVRGWPERSASIELIGNIVSYRAAVGVGALRRHAPGVARRLMADRSTVPREGVAGVRSLLGRL